MSDSYETTRESLHGVTVHMHRTIYPFAPDRVEETAHLWVDNLPLTAIEVARWFACLPPDADVRNDDENPGSLTIDWSRPATADEVAAAQAKRDAERVAAELWAEFTAWEQARGSQQ